MIQTTQEFLPLLKNSSQPAIINVSSEIGSLAIHTAPERNPNRANYHAYGTSKTAVNSFTVMLANELRDSGISVNSVTPGYTATDLNGFEGAKTVEEGALPIVKLAVEFHLTNAAKFFKEGGEVPW
jgi:NAD(P)-dependent dehydrogenase (short-subunit alcohol dehydrogenase family)